MYRIAPQSKINACDAGRKCTNGASDDDKWTVIKLVESSNGREIRSLLCLCIAPVRNVNKEQECVGWRVRLLPLEELTSWLSVASSCSKTCSNGNLDKCPMNSG